MLYSTSALYLGEPLRETMPYEEEVVRVGILLYRAALIIWAVAMAACLGQMSRPCANRKKAFPTRGDLCVCEVQTPVKWTVMTTFWQHKLHVSTWIDSVG